MAGSFGGSEEMKETCPWEGKMVKSSEGPYRQGVNPYTTSLSDSFMLELIV